MIAIMEKTTEGMLSLRVSNYTFYFCVILDMFIIKHKFDAF